jgi:predicted RNase H-like nuclease (RuvC/YqgF family)
MILAIILPAVLAATLLTTGCQEKDLSTEGRKSKLAANTNLSMKRQIEVQNKEIAKLTKLLADCKTDCEKTLAKEATTRGATMEKLLKMFAEGQAEVAILQTENAKLKKQIKDAGL